MEQQQQQFMHSALRERMMMMMDPRILHSSFCNEIQVPQSFTCLDQPQEVLFPSETYTSSFMELIAPQESTFSCLLGEFQTFLDGAFCESVNFQPLQVAQEEYQAGMGNGHTVFDENSKSQFEDSVNMFKVGIAAADIGPYGERSWKSKKPDGLPSKNLMAERRRRKRLNDRLSMLRSIVPKISKMDRTSILGDTIDYLKELYDKINKLREEGIDDTNKQMNQTSNTSRDQSMNELLARSPPKFEVNRQNDEMHIEVCCAPKPGLLLSTLSTLDSLGLDVEQCVISCFNDFAFRASCIEVAGSGPLVSCEDIKQALFMNAGCGGRNL